MSKLHYLVPSLKVLTCTDKSKMKFKTLLWVENKNPRKLTLVLGYSFENSWRERGLTTRNILQITTNEGVRRRPIGGCLYVRQRGTIEQSPGWANGTCVMSTDTVREQNISIGKLDAYNKPWGNSRSRRWLEGLYVSNKQQRCNTVGCNLIKIPTEGSNRAPNLVLRHEREWGEGW